MFVAFAIAELGGNAIGVCDDDEKDGFLCVGRLGLHVYASSRWSRG